MAHRRGSFRRAGISQSQRRKKAWIGVKTANGAVGATQVLFNTSIVMETAITGAAAGAQQTDTFGLVGSGAVEAGDEQSTLPEESTILRARGSLSFPKNSSTGGQGPANDNYAWGFGVTDIRSIVAAVVPLPITDVDWDGWMFLRQSSVAPVDSEGTMVDVKAMRKIKTGDALFFAAQAVSGDAVATPIGTWIFDMRLLILLP